MPALTAAQLAAVSEAVVEEVLDRGTLINNDRFALPILNFFWNRRKKITGTLDTVETYFKKDGGLITEGYAGYDNLTFKESDIAFKTQHELRTVHTGLQFTHDQMRKAGITLLPNTMKDKGMASRLNGGEAEIVFNFLKEQIEDQDNAHDENLEEFLILPNSADPLIFTGMLGLMPFDPTSGSFGGKPRASYLQLQHWVRTGSTVTAGGTLRKDLTYLKRKSMIYNRDAGKYRGKPDVMFAGGEWIDGYESYAEANKMSVNRPFDKAVGVDIGIRETDLHFDGIPIIHVPGFDRITELGLDSGLAHTLAKTCFGLTSASWTLGHTDMMDKYFSVAGDEPTARFTRTSIDSALVPVLHNPRANFISTIA